MFVTVQAQISPRAFGRLKNLHFQERLLESGGEGGGEGKGGEEKERKKERKEVVKRGHKLGDNASRRNHEHGLLSRSFE